MNRLQGKVALVTGAGRGIGKGIALAYAREGAFVVCTARTDGEVNAVADRIVAQGGGARAVTADVTDPDEVRRLFEVGLEGKGRLDILVANAGRGAGTDKATVAESDPAIWTDLLHVNLLGAYHCAREAIPHLLRAEAGKIIMMGSGSRLRTPPRLSAYSAAKAGLWALTRTLASELKPHHIAVNEIIPGPVLKEHMLTPEKLKEIEDKEGDRAAQRRVAQGAGGPRGAGALPRDAAPPGADRAELQSVAGLIEGVGGVPDGEGEDRVHVASHGQRVGKG